MYVVFLQRYYICICFSCCMYTFIHCIHDIETNIVFMSHNAIQAGALYDEFTRIGLATNQINDRIRLVTHCDVTRSDLAHAVELIAEVSRAPTQDK